MQRMNTKMRFLVASFLSLAAVGTACAAGPPAVVSAQTVLASNAAHAGKTEKLAVVAHIRPGYHINDHKPSLDYLIPTEVVFDNSPSIKIEKVVYPHGKPRKFAFLDSPISVYEDEFRVGVVLLVNRSVKPGTYALPGKLTYQACNNYACLPPASVPLKVSVRVVPSSVPLKSANLEIFKTISFR